MSDFRVIRNEGKRLSIEKYNQMHSESVAFLDNALKSGETEQKGFAKNIIVSHHVPTFQHYLTQYLDSILTEAFATDLNAFIELSGADYWVYGHHHDPTGDFSIGKTKLVTNQLGYVRQDEHQAFDFGKTIILK